MGTEGVQHLAGGTWYSIGLWAAIGHFHFDFFAIYKRLPPPLLTPTEVSEGVACRKTAGWGPIFPSLPCITSVSHHYIQYS